MKTLSSIRQALIDLRSHPEPDQTTFEQAASLLRLANDLAILGGITIEPVGQMVTPADAIAIVSRYINATPQQEWLSAPQAATLLGVSQAKIAEWVKGDRLGVVNVAGKGKRACYRIHRLALSKLKPENKPIRRHKPLREII